MATEIPTRKGYLVHGENGRVRSIENAWGQAFSSNRIMAHRIEEFDPFQTKPRFDGDWDKAEFLADNFER